MAPPRPLGNTLRIERWSGRGANFNPPHAFHFNGVYELPFGAGKKFLTNGVGGKVAGGWQVGGIVTIQQGLPLRLLRARHTPVMPRKPIIAERPDVLFRREYQPSDQAPYGNRNQVF